MFSIKENCLNFLEEHKQDNELYYKNGNGIQIFKSSDYGNGSFVTINITSFFLPVTLAIVSLNDFLTSGYELAIELKQAFI